MVNETKKKIDGGRNCEKCKTPLGADAHRWKKFCDSCGLEAKKERKAARLEKRKAAK